MLSRRFSLSSLVLAAALTLAAPAFAQSASPEGQDGFNLDYPDPIEHRERTPGPGAVDVTLKLAFVLGLFLVGAAAWKKFARPTGGPGGDEAIRLWASKSLGLGSEMYLVEVGNRMLLVGKSGTSISTLTEFADPDEVAELKATCVVPLSSPAAGNWLDRWMRREGAR